MSRGLIYTWRREASQGLSNNGFAAALAELIPVVVSDANREAASPEATIERRRACSTGVAKREGAIEIMLPGDVRMTVRGRVEERTLRAVLGALRSA